MLTGSQHETVEDVTALVRDAQAGDRRALDHLAALHLPLIYNIVGRALHASADVDDLVQETMLRVVRGLPGLREPERFRSWAVAIAYRQLQEHARRRPVELPHRHEVADVPDPSTDFADRAVAELVLAGQRRELVRATAWLDPADRQLLDRLGEAVRHVTGRPAASGTAAAAAVAVALTWTLAPWSGPAPAALPPAPAGSATAAGSAPADPPAPADAVSPTPSGPSRPPSPLAAAPDEGGAARVTAADIYLAPDGSDAGDGTLAHPYATLGKAVSAVRPGATIALRGGTYRLTTPVAITTSGTEEQRITLTNYGDERPVLDASAVPAASWTITQQADYWTVQGLELFGSASHAYVCRGCGHTVFQRLSFHDNARSGLTLRDAGTVGNAVLDSDFFHNHDDAAHGSAGIGLGITFGTGEGNLVRGCRLYGNATDGLDLGGFASPVTVEGNWSYGNGVNRWRVPDWKGAGNGFTLGGGGTSSTVAHVVTDNAAWDNTGLGFNDEGNSGRLRLTRNTAFRNGVTGFYLPDAAAQLSANAAVGNGRAVTLGPAARSTGNSWDGGGAGTDLLATTDQTGAEGGRAPDGGLPRTGFLLPRQGFGATMTERR